MQILDDPSHRLKVVVATTAVLAIAVFSFVAHSYFFELDLVVAWRGFMVVEYANSVLFPENYTLNYPGGASSIGKSTIIWVYPFLAEKFGIAPFTTMKFVMAIEVVALIFGGAILTRVLVKKTSPASYVLLTLILLASAGRQIDLARFGSNFFVGQFYIFADVLRILALCAFIERRYFLSLILLCLGFTVHPSMTVLTLPVLFAFALVDKRVLMSIKPWLAGIVFSAFSVIWFILFIAPDGSIATTFPDAQFFTYSRLFNSHWYIADLGMVLEKPSKVLLPFMSVVIVGLEALRRTKTIDALRKQQILAGVGMVIVVSLFGLYASEWELHTAIVKISPQRISSFVGILLLPFIVHRLFEDLKEQHYGFLLMGLAIVLSAFIQSAPYPIALAFLYASPTYLAFFRGERRTEFDWAIIIASLMPVILLGLHWGAGHTESVSSYFGKIGLFGLAVFGGVLAHSKDWKTRSYVLTNRVSTLLVLVITTFFMWNGYLWLERTYTLNAATRSAGKGYLAAQLWANSNTKNTALFMTDPCILYGWRDFSNRSSWGTYQEFLKTSWLYASHYPNFQEGLRRAKVLGIDAEKMLKETPNKLLQNASNACSIARKTYYSADITWLKQVSMDYGVDYFIFLKQHTLIDLLYSPVYENEILFILEAPNN